jgi:hypothetical protein
MELHKTQIPWDDTRLKQEDTLDNINKNNDYK